MNPLQHQSNGALCTASIAVRYFVLSNLEGGRDLWSSDDLQERKERVVPGHVPRISKFAL